MALPSTPTTCFAVTAALTYETGRYQKPIYSKAAWKSPIIALQNTTRGQWMNALGFTHNILTYERSLPRALTAGSWNTIAPSDGDGVNACLPPVIDVGFAQQTRTVALRSLAVETPYFCIEDIRDALSFEEQLKKHNNALADVSWWVWRDRYYTDYYNTAEHNITINQAQGIFDNGGSGYSAANPANGALTYYQLEEIATNLILREGGMDAPSRDIDTNQPVVELILGPEMSRNLLRANPDIRDDLRYATMGEGFNAPLLPSTYNKRRNFGGFTHNIEVYPRRFNIVNGAYVEVPVWAAGSSTIGVPSDLNPDWLTAQAEEVVMWMPNVYRSLVPNTITNPAPGWRFDPVSNMVYFRAVNILERECNPDGTMIFWRAVFRDAAEPIHPEVGVTILAARCPINTRAVPCGYELPSNNGGYQ